MTEGTRSGALGELDPLIGLTISGRYRVHKLIGQGGMGKVFQAQQIPLGRSVALKVLDARGLDREFQHRFFQEAAILAKLKSNHTVTIYDYGRDGDFYFIAMELVTGESLDRVLAAEAPLPLPRVLTIAEHVCRSLREAHAQGVIHRDLKPGNVMLTRAEDGGELAKVLDFGLAKRVDRSSVPEDTQTDTVPGSPKYMAPEVVRQLPIDGRADMYGLGVMLYYMLTGVVPFDRDNPMDILIAHLQEAPRSLREANPDVQVPEALERIVMRCLAKTPEERFASMQELLDTLHALVKSSGRSSRSSWTGVAGGSDRPTAIARASHIAPSLRLEARDTVGPSMPATARSGRGVWIAGSVIALAVAGGLAFRALSSDDAQKPAIAAASPAAVTPAPVAPVAPTAQGADPTMVISPEEAEADPRPRVTLRVSSDPPGASVILHGKWIGTTPVSFEWRDAQAKKGAPLVVQLKKEGYAPYTIKRTIDAAEMELSATLEADDLQALEARARALQAPSAPAEVLKITPSTTQAQPDEPAPADKDPAPEGEEPQ